MLLVQILVIVGIISLCIAGIQYKGYLLSLSSKGNNHKIIQKQYRWTTLFSLLCFAISAYVFFS
ncbi:hypothetical protein [Bacillus sp. EAC]|uniref:hypothetical protein n=1 Tax=Bacillus sp. EAC TaxID=1978338 RepID=UPI001154FB7C|nr:hypothetical protein [Bacillus sp. EAC]